jgi:hypothetical protein
MEFDVFDKILGLAYVFLFATFCALTMCGLLFSRFPKLLAKILGFIGLLFALVGSYWTINLINADYEAYLAESECVTKYVSIGVERRNIVTSEGTCYVK